MRSFNDAIENEINGLHYGNRILLPFKAHVLKAIVENDIITNFSSYKKQAESHINESYTEIYFHDFKDLEDYVSKYEVIKMIFVEAGYDIFDLKNHKKIALHVKPNHVLEIEQLPEDYLFIE